jgi:hypothetical protein
VLCPAEQAASVAAFLADRGLSRRATPCPVATPASLPRALGRLCADPGAWLDGWPPASDEVQPILERAQTIASQIGLGYLGVEHLALALVESAAPGAAVERLRRSLSPFALRPILTGVVLVGEDPGICPTPRLRRVGAALEPDFGPDDLATALAADPSSVLHVLAGRDLSAAVPLVAADANVETARGLETGGAPFVGALEVLGGPEDGRALWLSPGDTLGRWAPQGAPTVSLYEHTRLRDRLLSRVHLEMLDEGRIRTRQATRMLVHGLERVLEPDTLLGPRAGDVLRLTSFSWLLATAGTARP